MILRLALTLALGLAAQTAAAHGGHDHAPVDVAADTAPVITDLTVAKYPAGGFTVTATTEGFTFAPDGDHGHLYINATKLAEMEAAVLHIPELPFGPHDFKLVLSGPDHTELAVQGRVISLETTCTVD